jgi:hypothetical protein
MNEVMPVCAYHNDRPAVAKISVTMEMLTPQGIRDVPIKRFVCQECAEGARRVGTPLLPLHEG